MDEDNGVRSGGRVRRWNQRRPHGPAGSRNPSSPRAPPGSGDIENQPGPTPVKKEKLWNKGISSPDAIRLLPDRAPSSHRFGSEHSPRHLPVFSASYRSAVSTHSRRTASDPSDGATSRKDFHYACALGASPDR